MGYPINQPPDAEPPDAEAVGPHQHERSARPETGRRPRGHSTGRPPGQRRAALPPPQQKRLPTQPTPGPPGAICATHHHHIADRHPAHSAPPLRNTEPPPKNVENDHGYLQPHRRRPATPGPATACQPLPPHLQPKPARHWRGRRVEERPHQCRLDCQRRRSEPSPAQPHTHLAISNIFSINPIIGPPPPAKSTPPLDP